MRIEFVRYTMTPGQPPSGVVVHTLTGDDIARDIDLSGLSLHGSEYFVREPRQLTFRCFADAWMLENILSGEEHDKGIHKIELRMRDDNGAAMFTGMIQATECTLEQPGNIMTVTAYDKLLPATAYAPEIIPSTSPQSLTNLFSYWMYALSAYRDGVTREIPMWSSNTGFTPLVIQRENLALLTRRPVRLLMEAERGLSMPEDRNHRAMVNGTRKGYCGVGMFRYGDQLYPYYGLFVAHQYAAWLNDGLTEGINTQLCWYVRWEVIPIFNTVCTGEEKVYDHTGSWYNRFSMDDEQAYTDALNQVITDYWTDYPGQVFPYQMLSTSSNDGRTYTSIGNAATDDEVSLTVTGNVIPDNLTLGNPDDPEAIPLRDAVVAGLNLHDATIWCDVDGVIRITSNRTVSEAIRYLDCDDVGEFSLSRELSAKFDDSPLSSLAGDTSVLKSVLEVYYRAITDTSRLVAKFTTLERLSLCDRIRIEGVPGIYRVRRVEPNPVNGHVSVEAVEV